MSSNSEVFKFSREAEAPYWGGGLHVTFDTHFWTQMSYSSQKSCVKIWFGLVEPIKSFHLNFPGGGGETSY